MEITNSRIQEMISNKSISSRYANWIHFTLDKDAQKLGSRRFKDTRIKISRASLDKESKVSTKSKRSIRIKDCLSYWNWDMYTENKLLDLKQLRRCKDRYCLNCRSVNLAKNIVDFYPIFEELKLKSYTPYLLTLTVPNVYGADLKNTIESMNNAFSKSFWRGFFRDIKNGGYHDRLFKMEGAIKVIEVTKNNTTNTFHPHFHFIVFLDGTESEDYFTKCHQGEYNNRTNNYNFISQADLHIREKWTSSYQKFVKFELDHTLLCDIKKIEDDKAIYEVFKYTFKDSEINNFSDFAFIFDALHRRRIRQGYGILYNLKLESDIDDESIIDDIKIYLNKNCDEQPESLTTKITNLPLEYNNYMKISRFNSSAEILNEILRVNS